MIKVSAPGKIHLTSAHIVVYGKPAILCAVDLRIHATLKDAKLNGRIKINEDLTDYSDVIKTTQLAKEIWMDFVKDGNIQKLKEFIFEPSVFLKIAIGETLLALDKKLENVEINISSKIPIGANFGSSASLATVICAGLMAYFKMDLDKNKISEIIYETEKRAHGNASGGDPMAIIFGCIVWYRKETEFIRLAQKLSFSQMPGFLIINSGKPAESTLEMVASLRNLKNKRPKYVEAIFDKMEDLKKQFVVNLNNNNIDNLINIMRRDVRFLKKLDLISKPTFNIICDLEYFGAGVSVSGGCGKKAGSGALIVLAHSYDEIIKYCKLKKLVYYDVAFQTEGVRIENG